MIIPAPAIRRFIVLGLMLAILVTLADRIAREEVRKAASEIAFADAVTQRVPASNELTEVAY